MHDDNDRPGHLDITVHLHIHDSSVGATTDQKLDKVLALLTTVVSQEKTIMADLTALEAEVQKNTDVEASAVVLIQGIAQQLKDAGTDVVKLDALRAKLSDSADALSAAITANTPAAGN